MTKALVKQDVSGTTPEGTAAVAAPRAPEASGKRPIWSRQMNRVEASIWKHDQSGEPRYTVSITRSYLHKRTNQWKRDSYFDRRDLVDVIAVCNEAEAHILGLEGMTTEPAED